MGVNTNQIATRGEAICKLYKTTISDDILYTNTFSSRVYTADFTELMVLYDKAAGINIITPGSIYEYSMGASSSLLGRLVLGIKTQNYGYLRDEYLEWSTSTKTLSIADSYNSKPVEMILLYFNKTISGNASTSFTFNLFDRKGITNKEVNSLLIPVDNSSTYGFTYRSYVGVSGSNKLCKYSGLPKLKHPSLDGYLKVSTTVSGHNSGGEWIGGYNDYLKHAHQSIVDIGILQNRTFCSIYSFNTSLQLYCTGPVIMSISSWNINGYTSSHTYTSTELNNAIKFDYGVSNFFGNNKLSSLKVYQNGSSTLRIDGTLDACGMATKTGVALIPFKVIINDYIFPIAVRITITN